jgi:uncharacterized protein
MFKRRIIFSLAFLLLIAPLLTAAFFNPGRPTGFVNDFAGLLTLEQGQALEDKLANFEKETTNEISVVIIESLQGDTIENFAVELFEEWGIGKKDKDNGVLILIAEEEREIRIEVGYGLEGFLTDAQSYWIIDKVMVPSFREGNYYEGINGATDKIIAATRGEEIPVSEGDEEMEQVFPYLVFIPLIAFFLIWLASILGRSKSWWLGGVMGGIVSLIVTIIKGFLFVGLVAFLVLIPFGLLFDFIVSRAFKKSKERGQRIPWWAGGRGFGGFGSGSGGGGFGGFGGGSSGGGGASGSW